MPRADAALAGIAVPMAVANPIAAAFTWPLRLWWHPRLSWCGPVASAPMVSSGLTDAAAGSECDDMGLPKSPAPAGLFVCPRGWSRYLQFSLPPTNSSALPPVGRRQTYQPLAPAGICCEQEIVTGPSAALNVQSTLQVTARSDALSVLTITESFAGDIAQE